MKRRKPLEAGGGSSGLSGLSGLGGEEEGEGMGEDEEGEREGMGMVRRHSGVGATLIPLTRSDTKPLSMAGPASVAVLVGGGRVGGGKAKIGKPRGRILEKQKSLGSAVGSTGGGSGGGGLYAFGFSPEKKVGGGGRGGAGLSPVRMRMRRKTMMAKMGKGKGKGRMKGRGKGKGKGKEEEDEDEEDEEEKDDGGWVGVRKTVSASSTLRRGGKDQVVLDDIEFVLDGLASAGGDGRKQMAALDGLVESLGDSDTRLLLRAHGKLESVLTAVVACTAATPAVMERQMEVVGDIVASSVAGEMFRSTQVVSFLIQALRDEHVMGLAAGILDRGCIKSPHVQDKAREGGIFEVLLDVLNTHSGQAEWKLVCGLLNSLTHASPINCAYVLAGKAHADAVAHHTTTNELLVGRDALVENARVWMHMEGVSDADIDSTLSATAAPVADTVHEATLMGLLSSRLAVIRQSQGYVELEPCGTLLAILDVVVNVTHENTTGAALLGQDPSCVGWLLDASVLGAMPQSTRHDVLTLALSVFINLVEESDASRVSVRKHGVIDRVLHVFERSHGFDDNVVGAGGHEAGVVLAYAALFLGFCSKGNVDNLGLIASRIDLGKLIEVLESQVKAQVEVGIHTAEQRKAFNQVIAILRYHSA